MSTIYTGDPLSCPADITIPSDGDDEVAESVNAAFRALADCIHHIGAGNFDTAGTYPLLIRTVTRVQSQMPHQDDGTGATSWTYDVGGGGGWWRQMVISTPQLVQPLDIPDGSLLDEVVVWVKGSPTDAGLPASMPSIKLYEWDPSTGTQTLLGSATDASANLAAYQAIHSISISPGDINVNKTFKRYTVELDGEHGAGANADMLYLGTVTACLVSVMDPGAS